MNELIRQIKDSWIILVFVAGIIVWYANTNSRISAVEAKQEEQEAILQSVTELKIKVSVIDANVEFIKNRVK